MSIYIYIYIISVSRFKILGKKDYAMENDQHVLNNFFFYQRYEMKSMPSNSAADKEIEILFKKKG